MRDAALTNNKNAWSPEWVTTDLAHLRGLEKRLDTSGRGGAAECVKAGALRRNLPLSSHRHTMMVTSRGMGRC